MDGFRIAFEEIYQMGRFYEKYDDYVRDVGCHVDLQRDGDVCEFGCTLVRLRRREGRGIDLSRMS
jgi:hypothetical protein